MSIHILGKYFLFATRLFVPAEDILQQDGSVIHRPIHVDEQIQQCYAACLNISEGRYQIGDFTRVQIGIINGWLIEQQKEA